jgi:TonB family protein
MSGPRTPQPPQQAIAQNQAPTQQSQQGQPQPRPQFETNQTAEMQLPPRPNNNFSKYATGMSAGSAIQQATQAAAASRGGGGQGGDFGLDSGAHGRKLGALDILSDTTGWNYAPYIERVVQEVREHWYEVIPESAEMKKGKLAIEFAITRDGSVANMHVVTTSGDVALDRAAWGGISGSNPFSPLPNEFRGPYLELRFRFYYNPDKADLQ